MTQTSPTSASDPRFVAEQYRNAGNLNTRISIHDRFSRNAYGWHCWLFDQLDLPAGCRVIELGGGAGDLWRKNVDRLCADWQITFTDLSPGMVQQARAKLQDAPAAFRFLVTDAQRLPLSDASVDVVLACHMLYHVPSQERALAEIRRVLVPGGRLYASTIGARHLVELSDLARRFHSLLASWNRESPTAFLLENGAPLLARYFATVTCRRYDDALLITEPEPLADYLLSGSIKLSPEDRAALVVYLQDEIVRQGGTLTITKDTGLFIAEGLA